MSYARWSSLDFRSDVYVYEAHGMGYVIHVAEKKIIWTVDLPPRVPPEDVEAWVARSVKVSRMLDDSGTHLLVDLDHPDAGKSFVYDTPGEAATKLIELSETGVTVPAAAIDILMDEEEDE